MNGVNHKPLNDWDDAAVGLDDTDRNHARTNYQAYDFDKKRPTTSRTTSPRSLTRTGTSTRWGRAVRVVTPTVSLTGEWAEQWGAEHDHKRIAAWGGYTPHEEINRNWSPTCRAATGRCPAAISLNDRERELRSDLRAPAEVQRTGPDSQPKENGVGTKRPEPGSGRGGRRPWKPINWGSPTITWWVHHLFQEPGRLRVRPDSRRSPRTRIDDVINKHWSGHSTIST